MCVEGVYKQLHTVLSGTLLVQAHHVYKQKQKRAQAKRAGQKSRRRGLKSRKRGLENRVGHTMIGALLSVLCGYRVWGGLGSIRHNSIVLPNMYLRKIHEGLYRRIRSR